MKRIKLTRNKYALVDNNDYEKVSKIKWYCTVHGYAANRNWHNPIIYMHRFIMESPQNKIVDHINGNKLDNRRKNLRISSHYVNGHNRHGLNKNNTSGHTNVFF